MRGDQLRDHILWSAKNVFLEVGFERASMDEIASRAETSKRTLYAHFENKEKLYLAVVELVRALFVARLRTPAEYPGSAEHKIVAFCARFLEAVLYSRTIQMCRLSIAEASRSPQGSARYFDVVFTMSTDILATYLKTELGLTAKASGEAAQGLLGRVLHPRFSRALFGMDELHDDLGDTLRADFDTKPIKKAVAELLATL